MTVIQDGKRTPTGRLTRSVRRHARPLSPRGLTLIETLIAVAIIALLLSFLMPALASARGQMKSLKCASNLRTVGFEFQLFAEGHTPQGRGDSRTLGPNRFYIEDFQDYVYRIDEFWDSPLDRMTTIRAGKTTMMCPAGALQLTKRAGFPCSSGAIEPERDVTFAINMRLYRAEIEFMNRVVLAPAAATHVSNRVLEHPYTPLLMEVDGKSAVDARIEPFYIAPPQGLSNDTPYASGTYWIPGLRHAGRMNVVFVGGHVLSSSQPRRESWDWSYQADVGN